MVASRQGAFPDPGLPERPLPPSRKRNAWSYIDARDLGEIVHLCLEKDGLGFQVFNAVNDTATVDIPTSELLARHSPGVPVTRPLGEFEARFRGPRTSRPSTVYPELVAQGIR